MASLDSDLSPAQAAALHEGLAHPARVAALRILRAHKRMPLARLREEVARLHAPLDTRGMRHHVDKLARAGLVDLAWERGRVVAVLLQDASLRIRLP